MRTTTIRADFHEGTVIAFQKDNMKRNPMLYNVTQIGHIIVGKDHSISRSVYDAFAILFVDKGCVKLTFNDEIYYAYENDLVFINQSIKHTIANGSNNPFSAYFMYVFGNNVKDFWSNFHKKHNCILRNYDPSIFIQNVEKITNSIIEGNEDKITTSVLLYEVLANILRYCNQEIDFDISKAIDYINENFTKIKKLDEVYQTMHINKYYLIKLFHARMGLTPKEYLNKLRFENALKMLRGTDYSISKIALLNGFSDARSLTDLFRKQTGLTPTEWKNREFNK